MRTIRHFLFLLVIASFVVACGGAASAPYAAENAVGNDNGGASGGEAPAAPAPGVDPANGNGQVAAVDNARIIRTGTMSLDVTDVGTAVRAARDAILGFGGYIGASNTSNEDDRPRAEVTYRIPVARWEEALDALRSAGGAGTKVVTENTQAVEVTAQVIDLDARIANLEASETALQAISVQATKISDILDVQARLTETRGQIEALTAQRKDLNDRSAFASMTVSFNSPVVAVEVAAAGWDPAEIVDSALATSVSVVQGLATAGIWFVIVWLPIIVVLVILAAIAVALTRRFTLGRRAAGVTGGPPPAAPMAGEG